MGAIPWDGGTTFRVWAPHAERVFVTGTFDGWAGDATPLAPDGDASSGTWSADLPGVAPGSEYRFTIRTHDGDLSRMDPYARQLTSSVGNVIVYDPAAFSWDEETFEMPTWNDLVIYEMHVGTFAGKDGKPRRLRSRGKTSALPGRAWHRRHPGHAPLRVRR